MNIDYLKDNSNFLFETPSLIYEYALKHAAGSIQFATYIDCHSDDIVFRVYAFHRTKKNGFEITEVMRAAPSIDYWCVIKNLYYTYMGGYNAVFDKNRVPKSRLYCCELFDSSYFNKWGTEKVPHLYAPLVNKQRIFEHPRYKYCGLTTQAPFPYLQLYLEQPKLEYLGKLGLPASKLLLKKAQKDKQFIRYLQVNADDLKGYNPTSIIYAYENNMSVDRADNALYVYRTTCRSICEMIPEVKKTKIDRMRLNDYLEDNGINAYSYNDYLRAIKQLGLNLEDTKNIYPKDFRRMHDLRINEKEALRIKACEKEHRALARRFKKAAEQAQRFSFQGDMYCIVIPHRMRELVLEGTRLHHCVGRMGYDKKMADGQSLIAFVRKLDALDVPYVTVEYKPKEKRATQCYGDHDSRPDKTVTDFVDAWSAWVTEELKGEISWAS